MNFPPRGEKARFSTNCAILAAILLIILSVGLAALLSLRGHPDDRNPTESPRPTLEAKETPWAAYFSPPGDSGSPARAIIAELAKARQRIRVQAYSFTSEPIADAMIAAVGRGVDVQVILDARSNGPEEKRSQAQRVARGGAVVYLDSKHAIAHNKVIVIDGKVLIHGSYNFTDSAEHHNAESLTIETDRERAKFFEANWDRHKEHSERMRKQ